MLTTKKNSNIFYFIYLFISLIFLVGLYSLRPILPHTCVTLTASREKNAMAKGGEIWLQGITINGLPLSLSNIPVSGNWIYQRKSDAILSSCSDINSNDLKLILPYAQDISLIFGEHAWSGIVNIQDGENSVILDLYNEKGSSYEYKILNIPTFSYSVPYAIISILAITFLGEMNMLILKLYLSEGNFNKYYLYGLILLFMIDYVSVLVILGVDTFQYNIILSFIFHFLILLIVIYLYKHKNTDKDCCIRIFRKSWLILPICFIYRLLFLHNPLLKNTIVVAILLLAIQLIELFFEMYKQQKWFQNFVIGLIPCFCVAIIEISSNSDITNLSVDAILLNICIWILLTTILTNIFSYKKIGLHMSIILALLIGITNYYVIKFKMFALMPVDILNISTAMTVVSDYRYDLSNSLLAGFYLYILATMLIHICTFSKKVQTKKILLNTGIAISCIVVLCTWIRTVDFSSAYGIVHDTWNSSTTYSNYGFTASFISYMQTMNMKAPDRYSEERAEQILKRYETSNYQLKECNYSAEKPHIIAIMNESFSDLRILGNLGTTENAMWFIDSFDDCLEKGYTYMSVRGGGTCNSEFEFLTGNSMSMFADTFPYTQFNFDKVPSLVTTLENQGYHTIAMHPANATNYRRASVYKQMGFKEFYSFNDYLGYEKIFLDRTSDYDNYQKIIEVIESAEEPLFIFNVTIQNHGDYNLNTLKQDIPLIQMDSQYKIYDDVKMYLSLINESNRALEYLIQYFRNSSKPVILCFFGDHQPGCLNQDFETKLLSQKDNENELNILEAKHKTPYFIWRNFASSNNKKLYRSNILETSPNYLAEKVLSYANLQLTPYDKFLKDMNQYIRVINRYGYLGDDGIWYSFDQQTPYQEWIEEYRILQYFNLFSGDM